MQTQSASLYTSGVDNMEFVRSETYIDAMVLRDRDTTGNGSYEERLYVQQDANYNVTSITDDEGAVVERYLYDPYGTATFFAEDYTPRGSSSYAWVYLHQGGRFNAHTGLYHFRMREYNPTLGRWMQVDPIRYADGASFYQYNRSTPNTLTDPSGLHPLLWKFLEWASVQGSHYVDFVTGAAGGTPPGPPASIAGWAGWAINEAQNALTDGFEAFLIYTVTETQPVVMTMVETWPDSPWPGSSWQGNRVEYVDVLLWSQWPVDWGNWWKYHDRADYRGFRSKRWRLTEISRRHGPWVGPFVNHVTGEKVSKYDDLPLVKLERQLEIEKSKLQKRIPGSGGSTD